MDNEEQLVENEPSKSNLGKFIELSKSLVSSLNLKISYDSGEESLSVALKEKNTNTTGNLIKNKDQGTKFQLDVSPK